MPTYNFTCALCGEKTIAIRGGRKNPPQYCSQECYHESKKTGRTHHIICSNCGTEKSIWRPAGSPQPRFCNQSCYDAYRGRRNHIHLICPTCGIEKDLYLRAGDHVPRYCSPECYTSSDEHRAFMRIFMEQENRYRWAESEYKQRVSKAISDTIMSNPRLHQLKGEIARASWEDPEIRARIQAGLKKAWENNPERKNLARQRDPWGKFQEKLETGHRTDIETFVEQALISFGIPYEFEYHCGYYWIDFYLPDYNIGIECDESRYHKNTSRGQRRIAHIEARGIRVLSLPGDLIRHDVIRLLEDRLIPLLDAIPLSV